MIKNILMIMGVMLLPGMLWADDAVYCPSGNGFIRIGMSQEQVLGACGEPLSKQESGKPLLRKVPILELTYNALQQKTAFYGVWALPIGNTNTGTLTAFGGNNGGSQLQVTIEDNKIKSVNLNSRGTNAFSVCGDESLKIGDPGDAVLNACGEPSSANESFVWKPIKGKTKPQVWLYQSQFQPPMTLTFIDGKLQSIN